MPVLLHTLSQTRCFSEQKPFPVPFLPSLTLYSLLIHLQKKFKLTGVSFFFFNGEGQLVPPEYQPKDGETLYYSKETEHSAWAKLLLSTTVPDEFGDKKSNAWLWQLDHLNTHWRIALEPWETDFWELPANVKESIVALFNNIAGRSDVAAITLEKEVEDVVQLVKLCGSVLQKPGMDAFLPRSIVHYIPSIRRSLLDLYSKYLLHSASEMEYTRKLYSRLVDVYFPPDGVPFHHISTQKNSLADPSLPDFRIEYVLNSVESATVLVTKDQQDMMTASAVSHKDWRKLLELMRQSLVSQVRTSELDPDTSRAFGILFGGLTACFVTMKTVRFDASDAGTKLGFLVSFSKVLSLTSRSGVNTFYLHLAKVYNYARTRPLGSTAGNIDWEGSDEKLVGTSTSATTAGVLKDGKSGHIFPYRSFVPPVRQSAKRRKEVDDDDDVDHNEL